MATRGEAIAGRGRRGSGIRLDVRWIAILIGIVLGALTAIAPLLGVSLAGAAVVLALFAWSPAAGLALLTWSRSSLDSFQDASRYQSAFLINPASALGMVLIALALLFVGVRLRNRQPIDWGGRAGLAWGGWVAFSSLGVPVALLQLGGEAFSGALREQIRLTSVFALYLLVVNLARDRRSRHIMISALLLGLVLPAVVGIGQIFSGESSHQIDGVRRIQGTFVHPGSFGLYLAAIAMVSLGLWRDAWGGKTVRFWVGISFLTSVALLIFTYTRAALGIFLFALLVWGWMGSRRHRLAIWGSVVTAGLALAPFLAWRFLDLFQGGDPAMERTNSFAWRLLNFRNLLQRFTESPIVGFGLRTTSIVNPTRTSSVEGYERGFAPHSELIRVLVEQGIVGFVAYVVMVVLFVTAIKRMSLGPAGRKAEFTGLGRTLYAFAVSAFVLAPLGADIVTATSLFYVIITATGVLYTSSLDSGSTLGQGATPDRAS